MSFRLSVRQVLDQVCPSYSLSVLMQKLADPELASQKRQRKAQRRTEGVKRKREELRKQRSAGLPVKNRRDKRIKA